MLKIYFFLFRYLLTGVYPPPIQVESADTHKEVLDVLHGNLFDGDMGYNMVGFHTYITVFDNKREKTSYDPTSSCVISDEHSQPIRNI